MGRQAATSYAVAGLVEFGGGDYFWRIDEVEADGTVRTGSVWKLTVPDYLLIDDFESYSNDVGNRVFQTWVDGIGFNEPAPGHPGNGTGALVGHDVWDPQGPYYQGQIMEISDVQIGRQAMPLYFNNSATPYKSETRPRRRPQRGVVRKPPFCGVVPQTVQLMCAEWAPGRLGARSDCFVASVRKTGRLWLT